jgi:hypothetical protein
MGVTTLPWLSKFETKFESPEHWKLGWSLPYLIEKKSAADQFLQSKKGKPLLSRVQNLETRYITALTQNELPYEDKSDIGLRVHHDKVELEREIIWNKIRPEPDPRFPITEAKYAGKPQKAIQIAVVHNDDGEGYEWTFTDISDFSPDHKTFYRSATEGAKEVERRVGLRKLDMRFNEFDRLHRISDEEEYKNAVKEFIERTNQRSGTFYYLEVDGDFVLTFIPF